MKLWNKCIIDYITRAIYFEELRFIPVSRDFLRKLLINIEDPKYIEEFGSELGLTISKEYVSYFFPEVNPYTLIEFLD
jgi:hypothetical protein